MFVEWWVVVLFFDFIFVLAAISGTQINPQTCFAGRKEGLLLLRPRKDIWYRILPSLAPIALYPLLLWVVHITEFKIAFVIALVNVPLMLLLAYFIATLIIYCYVLVDRKREGMSKQVLAREWRRALEGEYDLRKEFLMNLAGNESGGE